MPLYVSSPMCEHKSSQTFVLSDELTEFLVPRFAAAVSICFGRLLFGPILTSMNRKKERINISQNALDKIF
jgi:hypothetical protein